MDKIKGGYYIKARCIQEAEIATAPPHVREIWDWLLKECNHADNKGILRGQCVRTFKDIQDGLSWKIGWRKMQYNKWQCEKAMLYLRKATMITTEKTTRGLIITVLKYGYYQDQRNYEGNRRATGEQQTTDTINNNTTNNESIKEVKETDTSCSEPQAATEPADTTILIYPCKGMGKKEWELKESKLKQYQESFPAIDILQHCKNARQWCIDNPSRQKTYSGMPKFLSKWLTKEQNKGGYNVGKDKPRNIQPEVGKYDNLKTIR
jgi:hypothetical protein